MFKFFRSLILGSLITASIFAAPVYAANAANLQLIVDSPASLQGLAPGANLVLAIDASNVPADVSTAEIVLTFDPKALQGMSIDEQSSVLAANQNIDNTNGKITVDIAKIGDGAFLSDTPLVKFTFTATTTTNPTTVSVDPASTLGYPNVLSASDYSKIVLTFSQSPILVTADNGLPVGVQLALAAGAVLILGILLVIVMLIIKRLRHNKSLTHKP